MIWDVVKAAVNQPKERIGGQMLTYLWCNDGHGKPRHENITSFKSGGIFASRFTKCQCSSHGEHSPWRLSGNCCCNDEVVRIADQIHFGALGAFRVRWVVGFEQFFQAVQCQIGDHR